MKRGGQDILLVKLVKSLPIKTVCLPGPDFKDTLMKASLAGYGKYFRRACVTNSKGPMKYHFCQGDSNCFSLNCKPSFSTPLKNVTGCSKEETPAYWSRRCSKFLHFNNYTFPEDIDEVHLFQISNTSPTRANFLETCYRQDPGRYGWGATKGNFNKIRSKEEDVRIATDWGWGFCSEECEQVSNEAS